MCPEQRDLSVRDAFEAEQPQLLPLPEDDFPTDERLEVHIGKTPYARFDCNDYSVPHTHVRKTLTVRAAPTRVRIIDGASVIAEHVRSWDRAQQIECADHVAALVQRKRAAAAQRVHDRLSPDRLSPAVPGVSDFLRAVGERGHGLTAATTALLTLLDQYGAPALEDALREALERRAPHPHAVRQSLERRRQEQALPPVLPVQLPDDPRVTDVVVTPHKLSSYDDLEGLE
ncbi:MAG: hypothetical protein ACI9OJ_004025 [Myxococcota bacterium]|jgi:hypothetical protein